MRTGVLNAIPFVVGAISLLYNSTHSDKVHERRVFMAVPMAIGGVALFSGIAVMSRWPTLSFILVCVAAIGAFAPLGPFWAVTTEWFSRKMAGSVAGFVNGVGNLGGFFGPLLVGYLNKRFGSFVPGFGILTSFMLIGAILPFFLKPPSDPSPISTPRQPLRPVTSDSEFA